MPSDDTTVSVGDLERCPAFRAGIYLFSTGVVAMLPELVPIFAEQPGYLRHALSRRT